VAFIHAGIGSCSSIPFHTTLVKKNMSEFDFPLPPPTFEFLVISLKSQAEMQLGIVVFGDETPGEPNLPAARHVIDILAMLGEKTRGNLSMEEQRLIENSLTELRFRYIQVTEEQAKAKSGETESPVDPNDAVVNEGGQDQAPE
jgi:Domain of unknown function (DUF1844)